MYNNQHMNIVDFILGALVLALIFRVGYVIVAPLLSF